MSSLADLPDPAKAVQVAKALDVSERTLHTWRKTGKLPAVKLGGTWYYRRAAIEKRLTPKAAES